MTVRMLVQWVAPNGAVYLPNNLYTGDAGTESGLVAAKLADSNLAGGTAYVAPTPPEESDDARVCRSFSWANRPDARAIAPGEIIRISDVGGWNGSTYAGSYWSSDGTLLVPVAGRFPLIHTGVPIGFANSGTVAAGAFTPTSSYGASRDTQTGVWLYFPASAGLPSGAGWYYCTSSFGAGPFQVYTAFWDGTGYFVPYKPASLTPASGGSSFTQTAGGNIPAMRYTVPAGLLTPNASLHLNALAMYGPAAGNSIFRATLGSSDFGYNADGSTTGSKFLSAICQMAGSTGRIWQPAQGSGAMSGVIYASSNSGNINVTASENAANAIDLTIKLSLGGATSNFEMTYLSVELLQ